MLTVKFITHPKFLPQVNECCIDESFEVKKEKDKMILVEVLTEEEDEERAQKNLCRFLIKLGSKVSPENILFV